MNSNQQVSKLSIKLNNNHLENKHFLSNCFYACLETGLYSNYECMNNCQSRYL